ncbi:hypothetical protein ACFLWG_01415 [Chloroflexota bacterium]
MGDLRKVTILSVLFMLIIGAVFSLSLVGCKKEDKIMDPANDGLIPETVMPAIDGQAPNRTETATFALG